MPELANVCERGRVCEFLVSCVGNVIYTRVPRFQGVTVTVRKSQSCRSEPLSSMRFSQKRPWRKRQEHTLFPTGMAEGVYMTWI